MSDDEEPDMCHLQISAPYWVMVFIIASIVGLMAAGVVAIVQDIV